MRAFAMDELGRPGSVRDIPTPEPREGLVRIRVAAAGVNPFDHAVIQGHMQGRMEHHFPFVPGMDASGTVDAVGDGVGRLTVGDDVFGGVGKSTFGEGTLAEFVTMSEGTLARKPAFLEHEAAAAIPVAGVTAATMLDAAHVSDGDVVVAIGATGGVGGYLVQLAANRGARVLAVCSGENADYARRLGAADVIDYRAGDIAESVRSRQPDGIDAVADMHGDAEVVSRLAEQVRQGGHVVSAVGAADAEALGARGVEATNVMGRVTTASLDALARMFERKDLVAPELHSYALTDAWEALQRVGSGHVRGKIVVLP
jgi:NADPH:quinone reductase-like Zn-dependent oxidoreductase